MGLAKLDIYVSGNDDPCTVDNRTWFVTIYTCDGNVLEWCGKRYAVMPARCGRLEVEVPPGCYYIKAGAWRGVIRVGYLVNWLTDAAIVTACCDQTTCVRLFNPNIHRCGKVYLRAVQDAVAQKAIPRQLGQQLAAAVEAINLQVGEPARAFELEPDHVAELDRGAQEWHEQNEKDDC